MLFLRKTREDDYPLVLSWRNNPLVWKGTYTQDKPITWEEHLNWFLSRKDHISFMVILLENQIERPIGILNISPLSYWSPEIGIVIGEVSLWNRGYGTEAFKLGLDYLKSKNYKWTSTTVKYGNKSMIDILKKFGFVKTCQAREGESRYAMEL